MKKKILILIFFFNFNLSYSEDKLAYIDINYILNNSIVGQSITKHIQNINKNKNKEFLLLESELKNKEKDIITKKNIIEKNEFEKKVTLLKDEINEYNNKKNKFNKEIEDKKIKYTKIVLKKLNLIVSKYVEENSIAMVLPKKNIIIAKKKLDITNEIMNLLNNQLKIIDF
tara:strand:- start:1624 stop:2136 length:513 start_codon:yes stop_codon:yes gene_type:complete